MSFNLSAILRESAQQHPDHPAIVGAGGALTYAELDARSDRVASGLVRLGIEPGDAVALQLPNVIEFVEVLYGVLKAGAVLVPLNVLNKGPEIAYMLQNASVKAMITSAATASEAARGAAETDMAHLYVVDGERLPSGVHSYTELSESEVRTPAPYEQRDPGDTAVLLYTSGTTGKPKGVRLTHFQLFMNARAHTEAFEMGNSSVTIAVMPLFHALGLSGLLNATVMAGGTVVLLPKFDPTKMLEAIQEHRATILHGVPTMYHAILHHPDRASYDTSSLLFCGSAGAAIAAELLDKFEVEFGVAILEMYGLTESGPLASYNRPDHRRPYSIGTPIWGTEIQIWDEANNELPPGKGNVGELVIRGHNTMGGYLNNDEATEQAFAGGWLHSGDLGYRDEDGFLFIVDRKKEMIIRGGYNVYPREVEEVLYTHPAVFECAVVGIPDERLGEEVRAYVSVKVGASIDPAELVEFVKDKVAAYKYPRSVIIVEDLPKTATGKIIKRDLPKA